MKNTDRQNAANGKDTGSKITSRQIVAIIGVILLILLYVITLVLAMTDNSASGQFFAMSLCGTLIVPIIIFLYSLMYGRITGKGAIGDPKRSEHLISPDMATKESSNAKRPDS